MFLHRRVFFGLGTLAVLVAPLVGWWGSWWAAPVAGPGSVHRFFDAPRALVWAHQGASLEAPPNTFAAFDLALTQGADVLETDLRLTRDGVVVLLHDADVDGRTDGTGPIVALSAVEAANLDAGAGFVGLSGEDWTGKGAGIPTLEAFLQRYAPVSGLRFSLELKVDDSTLSAELCRLIEAFQLQSRVVVPSFSTAALTHFRATCGGRVATLLGTTEALELLALYHAGLGDRWSNPADGLATFPRLGPIAADGPALHAWLQERRLPVILMTLNEPEELRQALALGASGVITDRPGLARQIIAESNSAP